MNCMSMRALTTKAILFQWRRGPFTAGQAQHPMLIINPGILTSFSEHLLSAAKCARANKLGHGVKHFVCTWRFSQLMIVCPHINGQLKGQ
jgi:hypothetical protein